jgi:hypothetical protein
MFERLKSVPKAYLVVGVVVVLGIVYFLKHSSSAATTTSTGTVQTGGTAASGGSVGLTPDQGAVLAGLQGSVDSLTGQNANLSGQVGDLTSQLTGLSAADQAFQQQAQADMSAAQSTIGAQRGLIDVLQAGVTGLTSLTGLQSQVQQLQNQIAAATYDRTNNLLEVQGYKDLIAAQPTSPNVAAWQQQVTYYNSKVIANNTQLSGYTNQMTSLQTQVKAVGG